MTPGAPDLDSGRVGRRALLRMLGRAAVVGIFSRASAHSNATAPPNFNVREFGAHGDGVSVDLAPIRQAIAAAIRVPGATLFFPPGDYWLGDSGPTALLLVANARGLRIVGDRATLQCRTNAGTSNIFKLLDCYDLSISGFDFQDLGFDRNINWKGSIAIMLSGEGEVGCQRIEVRDANFESLVSAVTVAGSKEVRDISLQDLRITHCYYGLNFQNNGNELRARGIACKDVKRSYFPYGVTGHRLEMTTEDNATGFTDLLIKCYSKPTRNLDLVVVCRRKHGGDAILAFDQQHEAGRGVISDMRVRLQVEGADCGLHQIVLFRSFTPDGHLEKESNSRWERIVLDGRFDYCESSTQLIGVASVPRSQGSISLGATLAPQYARFGQLPGFTVTRVDP